MSLTAGLTERIPELAAIYRDLHEHPELSFQEERTAGVVAARLAEAGFEVTTGVGGTGVVGVLRNGSGGSVLLRADMDALPVLEADRVPYRSTATAPGPDGELSPVMHACGHDTHVTSLLGAAMQLSARRSDWSGTVLAVFQPAELPRQALHVRLIAQRHADAADPGRRRAVGVGLQRPSPPFGGV